MKNLLTVLAVMLTAQLFAQSHEIIKHDGEKLNVNFIKIESNLVYYTLPNSMEEQKISRYAVAQLNEKSNKKSQILSNKINLTQKSEYKKVIILKESETIGLKTSGDLTLFFGKTKGQTKQSLASMGEKRLKENAAQKGNPFIVITSNKTDDLKATAYTY
ncbi:hypothetical protein [Flavobacterium limnophilum]|uniref:hypothetical protein n=1 Tax=Flavobacterium limnophilum TaxID=3003262 RepID=UPI0022AC26D6|nr:hypothetical protein [Flavobacterium limnophilum]